MNRAPNESSAARYLRPAATFAAARNWDLAESALRLALSCAGRERNRKLSGRILLALAKVRHAATSENAECKPLP